MIKGNIMGSVLIVEIKKRCQNGRVVGDIALFGMLGMQRVEMGKYKILMASNSSIAKVRNQYES